MTCQVIFDIAGALNTFKVFIAIDNSLDLSICSAVISLISRHDQQIDDLRTGCQKPGLMDENYSLAARRVGKKPGFFVAVRHFVNLYKKN